MNIYCGECGKFILTSDIDWPHEAVCKNCQKRNNSMSCGCAGDVGVLYKKEMRLNERNKNNNGKYDIVK